MTDERTAYSDLLDFSEQLSCRKLFHPSYGLISTNFQRSKHFMKFIKIKRNGIMMSAECQHDISRSTDPLTGQTDQWVLHVIDRGLTVGYFN